MIQQQFDEATAREINGGLRYGKIKTRDGQDARIICWNAEGEKPIVALVRKSDGEYPHLYTTDGRLDSRPNVTSNLDLVIETEGGEA